MADHRPCCSSGGYQAWGRCARTSNSYVQMRWGLPFSYYDEALETLLPHGGDVWIVTDDSHDPFLRHFSKWKPKFFRGNPLETMLFMSGSSKLVLSQSTFGWWPAFLGDVESVACPLPQSGIWSDVTEFPGIDLIERDRLLPLGYGFEHRSACNN